jgi:16S rRNA (guanine1207-N2)-methyltransferase
VLTNPPYYSNYRIAELFLEGAHHALKPGGRVQVVTKNAEWYQEQMPRLFDQVTVAPRKSYQIVSARKRRR